MYLQVAISLICVGYAWWFYRLMQKTGARPISWFILPWIGTVRLVLNRFRVHEYSREYLAENEGQDAFTMVMPGLPTEIMCTITTSAINVKHILKDNFKNYPKGPMWKERLTDVLGTGIFNADGDHWKLQRKTASLMFSRKILRSFMLPIFWQHANKAVSILFNKIKQNEKSGGDASHVIDVQRLMNCFTIDSIGHILFGKDIDSLTKGSVFANAFDLAQQCSAQRFVTPGWQILRFIAGFLARKNVTEIEETDAQYLWPLQIEIKLNESVQVIRDYADDIIEHKREILKKEKESGVEGEGVEHKDLLIKFMRDNVDLTNDQLRDVVLNFMIAGRDTTSNCLAWAMYFISQNPEVQKRLCEEAALAGIDAWSIIDKTGEGTFDSTKLVNTDEDANRLWDIQNALPYAEAVIMETLRMRPSVPVDMKWAAEDDVLPDGNIVVKKDTFVAYYPYVMGLDPKNYDDPMTFRPERWLEKLDLKKGFGLPGLWKKKKTPYEYPVFQAGQRTCLGMDMAVLEAKVCISTLISAFDFEFVGDKPPKPKMSLTIPMQEPLMMKVTER